jgi:1-aminocyclopropane-1-carboxylate deaminase/D-cysteine desulfhydrase-like pyridoxal-dependent ACC family enzyme
LSAPERPDRGPTRSVYGGNKVRKLERLTGDALALE